MRATFLLTIGAAFILSCGGRERTVTTASAATPPHAAPAAAATAQQVAELTKRIDELTKRVEAAEKAAQDAITRASAPVSLPSTISVDSVRANSFLVANKAEDVVAGLSLSKQGDGATLLLNSPRGGYSVLLEAMPGNGGVTVVEAGGQRSWVFPRR